MQNTITDNDLREHNAWHTVSTQLPQSEFMSRNSKTYRRLPWSVCRSTTPLQRMLKASVLGESHTVKNPHSTLLASNKRDSNLPEDAATDSR